MAEVDAEELVNRFLATWPRADIDEMLTYFADDGTYHNMPLEPAVGRAAIREHMAAFFGLMNGGIRPEVHVQLAAGRFVMNERTDHYEAKDGRSVALPICGVFEIEDGLLKSWREYFDLARFTQ